MDEIVFEALEWTPDTQGELAAALPPLRVRFDNAVDALAGALPALAITLEASEHAGGDLIAALPRLQARFLAASEALAGRLPALRASFVEAAALTPEDGALAGALPALAASFVGTEGRMDSLSGALPALRMRAFEAGGDVLTMVLPPLQVRLLAPDYGAGTIRATLLQSPGQLWALAPTTQVLQADAAVAVASEAAPARLVVNLIEGLGLLAVAQGTGRFRQEAESSLVAAATAQLVFRIVAEAATDWSAIGSVSRKQIITAVEVLEATAVATSTKAAIIAVAEALAMEALATRGWRLEAEASAAYRAELATTQKHWVNAIEAFALVAEASRHLRFVVLAEEGFALQAEAQSIGHFLELVEAGFAVVARFTLGNETYSAWVVNTESDAVSQYSGHDFNSLMDYDERYFGLKADGLYELDGGATDDGDPIAWRLRTGLVDFGSPQLKRVPRMYLAWSSTGQAYLKVAVTSAKGRKEVHWYVVGERTAEAMREETCPIGKGLESVFFQFTFEAIDGAQVDVDALRYVPLTTNRRS